MATVVDHTITSDDDEYNTTNFVSMLVGLQPTTSTLHTLDAMTTYQTLNNTSWKQDYDYVIQLCQLAQFLWDTKITEVSDEPNFIMGYGKVTPCYWYEVLWRVYKLSDRCITDVNKVIKLDKVPYNKEFEFHLIQDLLTQIKQTIGTIAFTKRHIEEHCVWATEHMENEWRLLEENRVALRAMGYVLTGLVLTEKNAFKDASNTFFGATKIHLNEIEDYSSHRETLMESIHRNAWIICHLCQARLCESWSQFNYAAAHYKAASKLGLKLTDAQQQVEINNRDVYKQAEIGQKELDMKLSTALQTPPIEMFIEGIGVLSHEIPMKFIP